MKRILRVALLCLCQILPMVAATQGISPGTFYLNVNPGAAWIQDLSYHDDSASGTLKFYPGPTLDLAGGYQFSESLAVEVQTGVSYLFSRNRRFTGFDEVHEEFLQLPIMANLSCQLSPRSQFHPFVGLGVGGVYSELYDEEWIGVASAGSDFTFGYQAFAGIRYQINHQLSLGLEYKFTGTLEHNFGDLHLGETRMHSLAVAISFQF
jgi:opacity protein-like surface antigen